MKFSIIIPLYACSDSIEELTDRIIKTLDKLSKSYEIIFVNDDSPENDWEIVTQLAKKNNKIKGINLSRNFGQHYAITAGLENAKGEWVIVMDGDLQDQPEEIIHLYNKTKEGFNIVVAKRSIRKDSYFKKMGSIFFYKLLSYLTDTKQDSSVSNFGIYSILVVNSILKMKDHIRYLPTMIQWVGFSKSSIEVKHSKRTYGKSSYSFKKLVELAFNNMIAFSNKPLKLMIRFGFYIILISLGIASYYTINYFNGNIKVIGFASLIISIWFLSGIIICTLGIIGIYIGKIFEKVKGRQLYIISDKININD